MTAMTARWKDKPNKGISKWNHGDKNYRVTLTIGSKQKTIGYTCTFNEAKKLYFDAFASVFGCEPVGIYSEELMKGDGRTYSAKLSYKVF